MTLIERTENFLQNQKILIIFIIEYILLLGLSYILSYQWMILVSLWFALSIYILVKKGKNLTSKEHKVFIITVITYPLVETIIKILIDKNILYGWATLNRLEHFSWSVAFTILIYMFFKTQISKVESKSFRLLILISIVSLVGIGNEFVEFIIREIYHLQLYAYYPDTIKDMITNLVGSSLASVLLIKNTKIE